jgi:glyoxylase-like metal-dependent hydrolase (beta-lactamase superfamily II)
VAEVIVLRAGYAVEERSGGVVRQRAGCTISLIRGDEVILVDTGGPSESATLVALLAGQRLRPEDMQHVIFTHGHIDHVGNGNLFPQATFISGRDRAVGDFYDRLDFSAGPIRLTEDVHIMPTPGHTPEDISVLVTTDAGLVAIVGDLFEHANDARDNSWLASSSNPEQQRASREHILSIARRIVPGHGDIFSLRWHGAFVPCQRVGTRACAGPYTS